MTTLQSDAGFGAVLEDARRRSQLTPRQLGRASGLTARRVTRLESGAELPTDRELGALAQACGVSVFDLLPAGYSLRVLVQDEEGSSPQEVQGREALDTLLREYIAMVVELRSGRAVTPPTLRHADLVELAAAVGATPESIEARLVVLLGAEGDASVAQSLMQLPGASR
jgi:transcriptional regulator with XRE-family HTH domain